MADAVATLHVCVTCRAGRDLAEGEAPAGRLLFDAVAQRIDAATEVVLAPVTCLASCERGCAAAISMPGKWSYLLGHLGLGNVDDLLVYARAYAASIRGTVLPSRRPTALRHMILGRFPAAEATP